MKIMLGVLYFEPAWAYGGPPRIVSELARKLVRRGHQVTVCTTDALDKKRRVRPLREELGGVEVVRFPNASNHLAYHLKVFLPRKMKSWLSRHISRFDVVHLFDTRTMLNGWSARAACDAGIPFVHSAFGSLPIGSGWRRAIKARFDHQYGSFLYGQAAAYLAQNDHEAQLYREHGAPSERVKLWPLAVDTDEFQNLPARGTFRCRYNIGMSERLFLFVGRINQLKGLNVLIRAFAQTVNTHQASRLVIVGRDDGSLKQCQQLVQNLNMTGRIIFPGPLYGRDVLPAYADCDLFVMTPIHYEETSLASLMACACGKPVLINDRCGIPWLDEYNAGMQLAGTDVDDIAQGMLTCISDPSRLQTMGLNAKRMIDERFAWPKVLDQIETIYAGAGGGNTH